MMALSKSMGSAIMEVEAGELNEEVEDLEVDDGTASDDDGVDSRTAMKVKDQVVQLLSPPPLGNLEPIRRPLHTLSSTDIGTPLAP